MHLHAMPMPQMRAHACMLRALLLGACLSDLHSDACYLHVRPGLLRQLGASASLRIRSGVSVPKSIPTLCLFGFRRCYGRTILLTATLLFSAIVLSLALPS